MKELGCRRCDAVTEHLATLQPHSTEVPGAGWKRGRPGWACQACGGIVPVFPPDREEWLDSFFTDPVGATWTGVLRKLGSPFGDGGGFHKSGGRE